MRHSTTTKITDATAMERIEPRVLFSTLPVAQPVAGAIATRGDQQTYTFTATGGASVEVSLGDTQGSDLRPSLQLLSPAGTRLSVASNSKAGTSVNLFYDVPSTGGGVYSVVVKDKLNKHLGGYNVELVTVPSTSALRGAATTLTSGPTINGNISHPGGWNIYTFSASAGNQFELSLASTRSTGTQSTGTLRPRLQVFSPTGKRVANVHSASSTAPIDFKYAVPTAGTGKYTVLVSSYTGRGTGSYGLQLISTPLLSPVGAATLSNNQPTMDALTRPGELKTYSFSAEAGNQLAITLQTGTHSDGFTPTITLYGPDGQIAGTSSTVSGSGYVTLSYTVGDNGSGTYTAVVGGGTSTHTGSYYLQVSGAQIPLPAWLDSASNATWDPLTHTLNVTGPTTITADPGSDLPIIEADRALSHVEINPGLATQIHIGGLDLSNGASVTVDSLGAFRSQTNRRVLVIGVPNTSTAPLFNVGPTSSVDLTDSDMAILYGSGTSPMGNAYDAVQQASDGGLWDTSGIGSSILKANPRTNALAVVEASAVGLTTLDGQDLGANAVVVEYARLGDVNLDGVVNQTDVAVVQKNIGNSNATWLSGDLNYDGVVSLRDYSLVLTHMQ